MKVCSDLCRTIVSIPYFLYFHSIPHVSVVSGRLSLRLSPPLSISTIPGDDAAVTPFAIGHLEGIRRPEAHGKAGRRTSTVEACHVRLFVAPFC